MLSARFRALTANSKQIRTDRVEAVLGAVQRKHAEKIKKQMQEYPPPIPTSNYIRTGDLGRGWDVRGPSSLGSGLITIVSNNVKYVNFVQGPFQTAIHEGRWDVLAESIDRPGYMSELKVAMRGLKI